MKKILLIILLIIPLIFSNLLEAQDIVYDSLRGNKDNWRKIKFGSTETLHSIWFENEGIIVRSKVLLSARVFTDLVKDVNYILKYFPFPTNTVWTEVKTTGSVNLIIYKYYGPVDTIFYVGLRKADLGSDLFSGKYMIVDPIMPNQNCVVNIYDGIGDNRKLFLTLKANEMNDGDIGNYMLSNQVTIQTINGTSLQLFASVIEFTPIDTSKYDIKVWPNPVTDYFNLHITNNDGVIVKIYDIKPSMISEEFIMAEDNIIDISSYKPGIYFVVIIGRERGNIIKTIKIIKN